MRGYQQPKTNYCIAKVSSYRPLVGRCGQVKNSNFCIPAQSKKRGSIEQSNLSWLRVCQCIYNAIYHFTYYKQRYPLASKQEKRQQRQNM